VVSDVAVIQQVLQGDRAAFADLVRKYQKDLMRIILKMVRSQEMADDIVQEAFLKAYRNLASFEGRSSFKSWLFQIAVNCGRNVLRTKRNENLDIDNVILGQASMQELTLTRESISQQLMDVVNTLPERQRTAVLLRVYEDMSFAEIAEIMLCPYDTAKANFRHGMLKLKQRIEQNQDAIAVFQSDQVAEFFGMVTKEKDYY
jgi:RNA polymerase sigma-70 factor (ECF subfamily)